MKTGKNMRLGLFLVGLGVLSCFQDKLFAGIEEQYTSSRKSLARERLDGFFVTNLTLFGKEFVRGLEVSASLYNLFDKNYKYPVASSPVDMIEADGRCFHYKSHL